jgi:hypothetical protein
MSVAARLCTAAIIAALAGCASAPKQTVELAEVLDQQIVQMQVSHERFVRLYYDGLRKDVDEFLEYKWIPQFLANVVEGKGKGGKEFRDALDRAYKLANVDWGRAVQIQGVDDADTRAALEDALATLATRERGRLGQVLLDFSTAAQAQIDIRRRTLIEPIDEQEAFVLDQLREGYADINRGSAALRGYLATVVNLVDKRDATLQQLGLLEKQRKLMDQTMRASQQAVDALGKADKAQDGIEDALEKFKAWKDKLGKDTP